METPKNAFANELDELQMDRKTNMTTQGKVSSQSSAENCKQNTLEDLLETSRTHEKKNLPNPIAMKASSVKTPSDFGTLNFNQDPKVNLQVEEEEHEMPSSQAILSKKDSI